MSSALRELRVVRMTRRSFLQKAGVSAGGLLLACVAGAPAVGLPRRVVPLGAALLRFDEAGRVAIVVDRVEMGQGIHTALAQIVADQLDLPWQVIAVETRGLEGPADRIAGTVASASVRSSFEPLRKQAATLRAMFVDAAASRLGVDASRCETEGAAVHDRESGRKVAYAELVSALGAMAVPADVVPRDIRDGWVGRSPTRLDLPAKVRGEARFGIDVAIPGMLHAAVAISPTADGALRSASREAAVSQPGVVAVVDLPGAIGVVAEDHFAARTALGKLRPEFEPGDPRDDSDAFDRRLSEALDTPGVLVGQRGAEWDPDGAVHRARFAVPFLAHAPMEPMNCTARVADGRCEVWLSTQAVSRNRDALAEALALPRDRVDVHPQLAGGAFGRRVESDFAVQAALLSRAVGRPVKLVWSRENDLQADHYRPACAAELEAVLDERGFPVAFRQHVAGPWYDRELPRALREGVGWAEKQLGRALAPRSLPDAIWWRLPSVVRSGVNGIVAGAGSPLDYAVASQRREYSLVECGVRIGWWRSVAASQNAFFSESFVDELAHQAGVDPVAYRRRLLSGRARAVLERVAQMSNWSAATGPRRGRGVAVQSLYGSHVALVAEVELPQDGGAPTVDALHCAVDCGLAISPDGVRAQIEGGLLMGLGAALQEEIRIEGGRVAQNNFHDYALLRMDQTPEIAIERIESGSEPGGVGELGTPCVAPAVANAIFAASGRRIRRLPLRKAFQGA